MKLKMELASVQVLMSRFEVEANFFKSAVERTQLRTKVYVREVQTLKDTLLFTRDALARVKVDGVAELERAKEQYVVWEKQVHRDFTRFTEELRVCEDWTEILNRNQSGLLVMAEKESVISCLMEVTGLKGELGDWRTKMQRLERNNKNLQGLTKLWRGKVANKMKELEELEEQIKDLKTQLKQEGCQQ